MSRTHLPAASSAAKPAQPAKRGLRAARERLTRARTLLPRVLAYLLTAALVLSGALAAPVALPVAAQEGGLDGLPGGDAPEAPLTTMPISAAANPAASPAGAPDDPLREASAEEMAVGFSVTVNTLVDEWHTDPNTAKNTKCSLREALQVTTPGQTPLDQGCGKRPNGVNKITINLQGGTYLLTRPEPLPTITGSVEMLAQGAVTVDGNGLARSEGIFIVLNCGECQNTGSSADDELLTLPKMKLQNGRAVRGAAIWIKGGAVTAREVTFSFNLAQHPDPSVKTEQGGAVRADGGEFICIKCIWRQNISRGEGGALSMGSVFALLDRNEFIGNGADYGGGAIEAVGGSETFATIRDSKFKENFVKVPEAGQTGPGASNGGGAIFSHGKMVIEKSEFFGNYTEKSKGGGAIRVNGELRVQDSAFQENQARKQGSDVTFGGAVLVEGGASAFFVRTSMHRNEAYNGGAIGVIGGDFWLVNSTVAQNNAAFDGGLAVNFQPSWLTGEAYIIESTLARNEDNTPDPLAINSANNYAIYMANSVIDSHCGGPIINSGGGNVFKETCARVPWVGGDDQTATDFAATYVPDIGFEGLNNNGGPSFDDAAFMSMKVDTDSPAVDLGRAEYCQNSTLVEAQDQIGGARPNGTLCDSGAMEVGSKPPRFESTPAVNSPLLFPAVLLGGGATSTTTPLVIRNTGGGTIQWQASIDEGWDGTFEVGGDQTAGSLGVNQSASLTLTCRPSAAGSYYGMLLVTTDTQEMPEVRYKLTCHSPNLNSPYAGAQQQPGPYSAGQAAPGETTQVTANVANPGSQPLQATYNWKQTAGNVWELVGSVSAVQAADGAATVVIPPGDELALTMKCKPQADGLFSNQVEITTNDPLNPVFTYDIGCVGYTVADPEHVTPTDSYASGLPGKRSVGIGLSPDGRTLIAGHWDNDQVAVWAVNPSNGTLSFKPLVTAAGMSAVGNIAFSPDGKNVYWASGGGDGVVAATVGADSTVSVLNSWTTDSIYVCGYTNTQPPFPMLCPIHAMNGARGITVSPDGLNVYVTGESDDTLSLFNRAADTGFLSFVRAYSGTIEGLVPLDGASGVVVSQDGRNVYVASRVGDSLAAFSRSVTGDLQFIQQMKNGVAGVSGLDGAFDLAESPDGRFVYVASNTGDALAVFARTAGDGMLTFVESLPAGDGPYSIEMSHDERGERVLVGLWQGDGVANFARDYATGKLTWLETVTEGVNAPGLDGVVDVVSSADDRFTYVSLFAATPAENDWTVRKLVNLKHTAALGNISPASAPVGSPTLVLTVNGSHFYPESLVLWNGAPLPTTFVSEFQLRANVDPAMLAGAGNASVTVRNPAPGGGDSAAASFAVLAANTLPVPSITSLNPPAATYGNEALNVVVTGAGFMPTSQARLNGGDVETIYVSPTTLVVMLSASDLSAPGPLALTVVNDSAAVQAGGEFGAAEVEVVKTATAVGFVTAAPNAPAQPSVSSFRPGSINAGSGAQWLEVIGSGFSRLSGAVSEARWNGAARPTSVLDSRHLLMQVTAADLASAGTRTITVFTPGVTPSAAMGYSVLPAGSNPIPVIETYVLDFDGGAPKLVVSGGVFAAGAQVLINGAPRPTTVLNGFVVAADVTFADLSKGAIVRVRNVAPGGGDSKGVALGAPMSFIFFPLTVNRMTP